MLLEVRARIWPPSCNNIWRRVGGHTTLSRAALEFRRAMCAELTALRARKKIPREPITCLVLVTMAFFPPDRRRRDPDNLLKAPLDALTHARVWLDDSQVRIISGGLCAPVKGGGLLIRIADLGEEWEPPTWPGS